MNMRKEIPLRARIVLTRDMLEGFFSRIYKGNVPELSAAKGLPYDLVYNLVKGRIRSLTADDYKALFGEEPPHNAQQRVTASFFRGMVKLWIFLNDGATEADLYREFHKGRRLKKIDYRIFSGVKVATVDARVEKWMERKFLNQGFEKAEIEEGIAEIESRGCEEKIPYREVKPVLEYLVQLGVSATKMLNQWAARYESGELQNVTRKVYDRALQVRAKAEKASASGSPYEVERLKEEVYGQRKGLILFSEVENELWSLKKYGRRSVKGYLGRSVKNYEKAKLKRISMERAKEIRADFDLLLTQRPPIPLMTLPVRCQRKEIERLLYALYLIAVSKLIQDQTGSYELSMIEPSFHWVAEKRKNEFQPFTPLAEAPRVLGMSAKAFDLLLASHGDLFKRIGKYEGKWFVPDRYLEELLRKEGFVFVRAKYEWLAKWGKEGEQMQVREVPQANSHTLRREAPEYLQAVSEKTVLSQPMGIMFF